MQVSNLCAFLGSRSMTSLPTTKVFRRKQQIVYGAESKGCFVWAVLLIVIPGRRESTSKADIISLLAVSTEGMCFYSTFLARCGMNSALRAHGSNAIHPDR